MGVLRGRLLGSGDDTRAILAWAINGTAAKRLRILRRKVTELGTQIKSEYARLGMDVGAWAC